MGKPAPTHLFDPSRYEHGQRSRYVSGCRCVDCKRAHADYMRDRRRRKAELAVVSSVRARVHLLCLAKKGIGTRAISDAIDVDEPQLLAIRLGRRKTIRAGVEHRILGADESVRADYSPIPSGPTWALLDDLCARGCTWRWISKQLGFGWYATFFVQKRDANICAKNAAAVARLHRRVVAGELVNVRPLVPVGPTLALVEKMRRGLTAGELSERVGFNVTELKYQRRVFAWKAERVGAVYRELVEAREDQPLPEGWQTSARPVTPMGAEEWALGGWAVARRTSKVAAIREQREVVELARGRRVEVTNGR